LLVQLALRVFSVHAALVVHARVGVKPVKHPAMVYSTQEQLVVLVILVCIVLGQLALN
jgi:hypothetical protein